MTRLYSINKPEFYESSNSYINFRLLESLMGILVHITGQAEDQHSRPLGYLLSLLGLGGLLSIP